MVKKVALLLLLMNFKVGLFSQPQFSKLYDIYYSWETAYNIIFINEVEKTILINGDIFNPLDTINDSLRFVHVHNFKLNFDGTLIGNYILGKRNYNFYTGWPSLRLDNINHLLIREDDLSKNIRYFIYELDSLGNFKSRIQVDSVSNFLNIKVVKQVASKIFAFGYIGNVLGFPFFALCFDTTGKQLWYKVYNDKLVFPTGVAMATDGSFLVGGVQTKKGDISKGERDSLNPFFAKMDTLGNFIWEKKIPNSPNLSVSNISPIEINGVYYWFGGYPSGQKDLSKLAYSYLIKTNTSGDIILNKKIIEGKSAKGDYMVCHLGHPLFKNKFIYMLGQGSDTISHVKYNDYIQLCKLDTFGNLKWRRTFSQWYMSNRPYSLSAISDGFIICADGKDTTHATGFTDAWIIKTDTNGCIIPGCHLADAVIEVLDENNYVKVYPNPANTQVSIEFNDPQQTKIDWIELLDEKGVSLESKLVNNPSYTLATAHLNNGMYYLAAYFKGNKRVVKKLVVQHE